MARWTPHCFHPPSFFMFQRPNPKKKYGVWDPMPELTITPPHVNSRVDSNTFTMGNPMPESTLTLCQSRLWIWPQVESVLKASDWRICRSKKWLIISQIKALSLERNPFSMGLKLLPKFSKFTSYLCIIQYTDVLNMSIYATVLCFAFNIQDSVSCS